MDPVRIEYDIGNTVYGQPLILTHTKGSGGEKMWVLRQEPANQRDEGAVISGLTDANLLAISEALASKVMRRPANSEYMGPG